MKQVAGYWVIQGKQTVSTITDVLGPTGAHSDWSQDPSHGLKPGAITVLAYPGLVIELHEDGVACSVVEIGGNLIEGNLLVNKLKFAFASMEPDTLPVVVSLSSDIYGEELFTIDTLQEALPII